MSVTPTTSPMEVPTGPIGASALGAIPLGGGTPSTEAIADAGSAWHSGAPAGEEMIDFRSNIRSQRVMVYYRKRDRKIVSVSYWNMDGHFSNDDLKKLLQLNQGHGISPLVSHLAGEHGDEEFEVTTAEQYNLEIGAPPSREGDAKMKARLRGTWREDGKNGRTFVFQSDGTWLIGDVTEKWDIQGGKLIEIRPGPESALVFSILTLTKNRFLAREDSHGQGYISLKKR